MSTADLILPGFYGKLPTTGDFVTRRLPLDFVQSWDRWLAKHLAPLIGSELWDDSVALRFLSGASAFGPAAGVVLPSNDRIGRRFPLSIVSAVDTVFIEHARAADGWFSHLETLGFAAQAGEFSPDELDGALLDSPLPAVEGGTEVIYGMVVWTAHSDLYDVDPEAPQAVLERLLAPSAALADEANHVR